jgi:hypothetical protein
MGAVEYLLPLALVIACQPVSSHERREGSAAREAAVINGQDDRRELYELDDAAGREVVERSTAALMWSHRLDIRDPSTVRATSAEEALALCPDERFAEQDSAAFCSAVLIDEDLVLSAGHCLGADSARASDRCRRTWIVFGDYYAAPGRLALDSARDVYACRQVVYHERASTLQNIADIAILKLDRPIGPERQRVAIASESPPVGAPLLAPSHGAGLPLKVDLGGVVIDAPAGSDYLVASTDSFVGGSGAPIFGTELSLVAYQVRGAADWVDDGGCFRASHAEQPQEEHQLARRAIEALCASGWPSGPLCGRAAACGDGLCSGAETSEACAEDCPPPACGDGLCEVSEHAVCDADCRAYLDVPATWLDDPARFRAAEPEPGPEVRATGGCSLVPSGARRSHADFTWLALLGVLVRRFRFARGTPAWAAGRRQQWFASLRNSETRSASCPDRG